MTKSSANSAGNKTRQRWLLALLGLVLMGWLSIVAAIEFFAPHWVENTLAAQISQRLGVGIAIERVSTKAFEGKIAIYGVEVTDTSGEPLLGFGELHLDYSWLSLLSPVWVLESAQVVAPRIHLRLPANGPLTLMQLLPSSDGPAVETPRWQLKRLTISQGELSYRDQRVQPARTFAIKNWGLSLKDIGTESANGEAELHGNLPAGATLDWTGRIGLQPFTSSGHLLLSQLSLPDTLKWLPEQLPLAVQDGRLTLDLQYQATLQPTLSVSIKDSALMLSEVSLAQLDNTETRPIATVRSLRADGLAFGYPSGQWASKSLSLDGAEVTFERDSRGEFTLLKALAGPPRETVSAPSKSPSIDWAGSIQAASVNDVMVHYRDLSTRPNTTLSLGPLRLSATPKAAKAQDTVAIELHSAMNTNATLSLRGELGMPSVRANLPAAEPYFTGQINIDALALTPFAGLLAEVLAVRLPAGSLSANGQLQWQTPSAPSWAWSGDAAITSLRLLHARGQPLLSLKSLQVEGLAAQGTPEQVAIKRVLIDSPKLRVQRQRDGSLSLNSLLKSRDTRAGTTPDVFIDTLAVRGGTVAFADQSVQPSMATALSKLNGSLRRLDLSGRQATTVSLRGYLPNAAAVAIKGQINAKKPRQFMDLSLRTERLALPPLSPYASHYAGYALNDGLLWADLNYRVNEGALNAENTVRISDFTWGEASDSEAATGLPVRLGTALLKDVNGDITLDVPLRGNLSDPSFRVWPLVWQTVGNLLTRAAAAPFKLLGGLASDDDALSRIEFMANSASLSAPAQERIKRLAASLADKPALRLSLGGHSDASKDIIPSENSEAASQYRYELAKARAIAVREALESAGVAAEQIILEQPKASTEASLAVTLAISLP